MARPKQTEEQIAAMRERILDAALALLSEQGPEALSIRAIAKQVGVSHMALYTYFENRAALIMALIKRQLGRMQARHTEILHRAETGDVCQVLRESLAFYAQMAQTRLPVHMGPADRPRVSWQATSTSRESPAALFPPDSTGH